MPRINAINGNDASIPLAWGPMNFAIKVTKITKIVITTNLSGISHFGEEIFIWFWLDKGIKARENIINVMPIISNWDLDNER